VGQVQHERTGIDNMKERLITLLLALAALAIVIFLLSPHNPNGQKPVSLPTSQDRGADGLKGMFTWLQREQVKVISFRKRLTQLRYQPAMPKRGNVLLMNLPAPRKFKDAEWSALSGWLEQGNSLIILGAVYHHPAWASAEECLSDVKHFLRRFDWKLTGGDEEDDKKKPINNEKPKSDPKTFQQTISEFEANVKALLAEPRQLLPQSQHALFQKVQHLETQITPNLLEQPWTLTSNANNHLALRLLKVSGTESVAAWQMQAGAGQIVLLLTPDVFSNSQLNHADNAVWLGNLLKQTLAPDGQLLFDDFHFGLSDLYDPEHFFSDSRLHQTLACIAVLWLFYLIGYTTRLAPVRSPTPKLSARDFIEVTAEFFARRLPKRLLAEALVNHLLADIARLRRLSGDAEAWHWLEQHSQIKPRQLHLLKLAQAKQPLSLILLTNTIIDIRTALLRQERRRNTWKTICGKNSAKWFWAWTTFCMA
jgi:hypothetical protein